MSDDLTAGLRQLAESGQSLPTASGADIRRRAHLRRRRRRTAAVGAGTVAAAAVALTLVLNLGGPGAGRTSSPAAGPTSAAPTPPPTSTPTSTPTSAPVRRAVSDATVNLSARFLVADNRKVPITSGLARTPTPSGRMTVTSMTDMELVSGEEVGAESGSSYKLTWVVRLRADDGTTTYLAAMPYNDKAPGNYDVTSGWIGLRPSDAKWVYAKLRPGAAVDIVRGRPAETAPIATPGSPEATS
ncbi:L,D-transpeptidase [Streptomyces sp. NPDC054834]